MRTKQTNRCICKSCCVKPKFLKRKFYAIACTSWNFWRSLEAIGTDSYFEFHILHIFHTSHPSQAIEVVGGIFALWKRILASRSFCPKYIQVYVFISLFIKRTVAIVIIHTYQMGSFLGHNRSMCHKYDSDSNSFLQFVYIFFEIGEEEEIKRVAGLLLGSNSSKSRLPLHLFVRLVTNMMIIMAHDIKSLSSQ